MSDETSKGFFLLDPYNVTNTERTQNDLEVFFLFTIFVAGKTAVTIAKKLEDLMFVGGETGTPMERAKKMWEKGTLIEKLKEVKMGKYSLFQKTFDCIFNEHPHLDLRTCSVDELETIPGISSKTSRFFILHSRAKCEIAVIDTHMLKCLRDLGYSNIPDTIPQPKRYKELEQDILSLCRERNLDPRHFDLSVWTWYSRGNKGIPSFLR